MASSIALKRLVSSNLLPKSLRSIHAVSTASSASRFFNTNAARQFEDDENRDVDVDTRLGRNRDVDIDSRFGRYAARRRDDILPDVFDPFSSSRSLSQVLNLMDQFMDNPLVSATRGMGATGLRRGWDAKETENELILRVDMPGLGKEDVKVTVEQNTLVIRGEGGKEDESEESTGRRYTSRLDLPEKVYNTESVRAEMKNGVLKVVVPKLKEEERADVRQIHVN